MEFLGFTPPSKNPRQSTSSLTGTMEFLPCMVHFTISLCSTSSITGTLGPTRELKQSSKGATEGNLVMFMAAAASSKADLKERKMEVCMVVYGTIELKRVKAPTLPSCSDSVDDVSNDSLLPLILTELTTTPLEEERQRVSFLWVLKESKTCEGSELRDLPRPTMPRAPLAKPFKRVVGEHVKRTWYWSILKGHEVFHEFSFGGHCSSDAVFWEHLARLVLIFFDGAREKGISGFIRFMFVGFGCEALKGTVRSSEGRRRRDVS
ncbi:hypothetical protein CR513_14339, partial [Mucuna pruriens]